MCKLIGSISLGLLVEKYFYVSIQGGHTLETITEAECTYVRMCVCVCMYTPHVVPTFMYVCVCVCVYIYIYTVIPRLTSDPANKFFG